jgi:hypothetical protein
VIGRDGVDVDERDRALIRVHQDRPQADVAVAHRRFVQALERADQLPGDRDQDRERRALGAGKQVAERLRFAGLHHPQRPALQ